LAVLREKSGIGWDRFGRERERLARVGAEILGDGALGQFAFQARRKQQAESVVERNQAAVEGGVVEARETKSVAHIEAMGGVRAPRKNVGGDEEFADRELRDAATPAEIVQDHVAEIFLTAALLRGAGGFRGTGGRTLADAEGIVGEDIDFVVFGSDEQAAEGGLAGGGGFFQVSVKFSPDRAIERTRARETPFAAQLKRGIERGQIGELHGETVGSAPEPLCQVDDYRLSGVKLPEVQLVIEVERDEEFVARPSFAAGHERRLRDDGGVTRLLP